MNYIICLNINHSFETSLYTKEKYHYKQGLTKTWISTCHRATLILSQSWWGHSCHRLHDMGDLHLWSENQVSIRQASLKIGWPKNTDPQSVESFRTWSIDYLMDWSIESFCRPSPLWTAPQNNRYNNFKVAPLDFSGAHPPNFDWLILFCLGSVGKATWHNYWRLNKLFKNISFVDIGVT